MQLTLGEKTTLKQNTLPRVKLVPTSNQVGLSLPSTNATPLRYSVHVKSFVLQTPVYIYLAPAFIHVTNEITQIGMRIPCLPN